MTPRFWAHSSLNDARKSEHIYSQHCGSLQQPRGQDLISQHTRLTILMPPTVASDNRFPPAHASQPLKILQQNRRLVKTPNGCASVQHLETRTIRCKAPCLHRWSEHSRRAENFVKIERVGTHAVTSVSDLPQLTNYACATATCWRHWRDQPG